MKSIQLSQVLGSLLMVATCLVAFPGCSGVQVKQQAYAQLKNDRTFEEDMPTVWKGIEATLEKYKVLERDPEEVSVLEMRKLTERTLKTDWIYGRSRDKYQEYRVNNLPRTIFLQTRFKYTVRAKTVIGGVHVAVSIEEEIEKLNSDGTSLGYSSVDAVDPARANDFLDTLQRSIQSAAP